jgi:hypothetical protein
VTGDILLLVTFCEVMFCEVTFCIRDVLLQVTFSEVMFCRGTFLIATKKDNPTWVLTKKGLTGTVTRI